MAADFTTLGSTIRRSTIRRSTIPRSTIPGFVIPRSSIPRSVIPVMVVFLVGLTLDLTVGRSTITLHSAGTRSWPLSSAACRQALGSAGLITLFRTKVTMRNTGTAQTLLAIIRP